MTGEEQVAETMPRTRRRRAIVVRILLWVLAILFAVWAILFITKGRFLRQPFERIVSSSLDRQVSVGGDFQLYFAPISVKFVAEAMRISNPDFTTRPDLFRAARIEARAAPWSLVFGRTRLRSFDLSDAAIDLEWDAAHRRNSWTFGEDKGGEPLQLPIIDRATLRNTQLRYRDPQMRLLADLDFRAITSADARIGDAVRFTGRGQVRDTPFTLVGALLSPNETVGRGRNRLQMLVRAAKNRITVAGDLPGLADIEGVPLAVRARGRDIAELLGIIGVAVPHSRAYRLQGTMVKDGPAYAFTRVVGRFGDSDLSGSFTARNVEPRLHMSADLRTRRLDIADVAAFIGYDPDAVAARGSEGAVTVVGGTRRILPDARLRVDALSNFDADLRWRVGVVRSRNVPVSDIDLTLDLDDRRLSLSPLSFSMARGDVSSDIVIDARQRPAVTRYDIRLAPTPMGRLLAGFGVAEAGTSGVIRGRIQLTGTGDTVHDSLASSSGRIAFVMPAGTFWTRNVELSELDIGTFVQKMFERKLEEPVNINCGLIAFSVRRGVATADPILIDTRKNVITGRGGFSFATEVIDLGFEADSKRFSLFSGQSPVALAGRFASPRIDPISGELLGRVGAGLGLGALAAPPAALLAFIDPGDAKAAACGPVLSGAPASRQRTTEGDRRDDVGREAPKAEERPRRKFLGIF